MNASRIARLLQGVAILILLALAWLGIRGGIHEWPHSRSTGQKVQSAFQLLYGVLSLLVIGSTIRPGPFSRVAGWAWVIALAIAGGLAPPVWGNNTWLAGLAAGAAAFCIGSLVLWLAGRRRSE